MCFYVETSLAACSSGPCENNGTCFDSSSETHRKHLNHVDDYECFCMKGFTGKNCERKSCCHGDLFWLVVAKGDRDRGQQKLLLAGYCYGVHLVTKILKFDKI